MKYPEPVHPADDDTRGPHINAPIIIFLVVFAGMIAYGIEKLAQFLHHIGWL